MKYASVAYCESPDAPWLLRVAGFYLTWPFLLGLTAFGLNLMFYTQALKVLPISIAYPVMTGAGFVFIGITGVYLFSEKLQNIQLAGIGLIFLGIILITQTS